MKVHEPDFLAAMVKLFPDIEAKGVVTRAQVLATREHLGTNSWPMQLLENKVGRGMYGFGQVATHAASQGVAPAPTMAPAAHLQVVASTPAPAPAAVAMASHHVGVDASTVHTLIPAIDRNYVSWGHHRDVDTIIKSRMFYPIYIAGPTGNGKSVMVEQVCAKNKRPLIRININKMTDEDQLIGTRTLVDGNVKVVEGPMLIAMRYGLPILLDEVDVGSPELLMCLQPILEGKPYYFKLKNELIYPAPGFTVFANGNTKGKGSDDGRYIGTTPQNEAFLERFAATFNQEYPSAGIEKRIIMNLMTSLSAVDEKFADTLVKWADAIRKTFSDGGIDETITTRRLTHIVRAYSIFRDTRKAVELCVNRFDDVTRLAFIDLFDKVSDDPAPTVEAAPVDIITPEF